MAYRGSRRQMSRAHQSVQTGHDGGQLVEPAGRTAVPVIDVQVHPFDRNHPGRPWASPSHGLDSATGEEMVAAMNSVGVDGAIMVSSFSAYETIRATRSKFTTPIRISFGL